MLKSTPVFARSPALRLGGWNLVYDCHWWHCLLGMWNPAMVNEVQRSGEHVPSAFLPFSLYGRNVESGKQRQPPCFLSHAFPSKFLFPSSFFLTFKLRFAGLCLFMRPDWIRSITPVRISRVNLSCHLPNGGMLGDAPAKDRQLLWNGSSRLEQAVFRVLLSEVEQEGK